MSRVTIETILSQLRTKMQSALQSSIDAVNQLNSDFEIESISDEAWIEGSLDETVLNFDQCCFYHIDDLQSIVNGPAVVTTCSVEFDLLISQASDFMDYKRLLRYQHALMEAARYTWGKVGIGHDKATITALSPIDVKLFNSSYWTKVIGIRIEFNLLN